MRERNGGFSLVEVMVAMVILTVGVLGLAASSAVVARMAGEGGRAGAAAAVANARFESLRATDCTSLASGSAVTGPYTETWTVSTPAISALLRDVRLTVAYNNLRQRRTATYETQISCAPRVR